MAVPFSAVDTRQLLVRVRRSVAPYRQAPWLTGWGVRRCEGGLEVVLSILPAGDELARAVFPVSIEGVPVRIERGAFAVGTAWWTNPKIRGGVAIRVGEGPRGTLGCLMRARSRIVGLTCAHVVGSLRTSGLAAEVEWRDRRLGNEWSRLGEVVDVQGIDHALRKAQTDSALVSIEHEHIPKIIDFGRVRSAPVDEFDAVNRNLSVFKYGAHTQKTWGRVESIRDQRVLLSDDPNEPPYTFYGVLEIEANEIVLCDMGDSGAVFFTPDGSPVGLLCSMVLLHRAYAVPMRRVCRIHDAEVIGAAGDAN